MKISIGVNAYLIYLRHLSSNMPAKKTTQEISEEEIIIDAEEEEPKIEDLPGVGPATAEK